MKMAHVAFPDEHYNKPNSQQHPEMQRSTHVNDNSFCGATVYGAAVWPKYLTYTHVNN